MKTAMVVIAVVLVMLVVLVVAMTVALSTTKFDRDVRPVYGSAQSGPAYLG